MQMPLQTIVLKIINREVELFRKSLREYMLLKEKIKAFKKKLNIMKLQKIRKKICKKFRLHQIFCYPYQNQNVKQNLLALVSYSFFYHG